MDVDNDVVLHHHNFDEFSITRKLSERLVVIGGASVYGQLFDVEKKGLLDGVLIPLLQVNVVEVVLRFLL